MIAQWRYVRVDGIQLSVERHGSVGADQPGPTGGSRCLA